MRSLLLPELSMFTVTPAGTAATCTVFWPLTVSMLTVRTAPGSNWKVTSLKAVKFLGWVMSSCSTRTPPPGVRSIRTWSFTSAPNWSPLTDRLKLPVKVLPEAVELPWLQIGFTIRLTGSLPSGTT